MAPKVSLVITSYDRADYVAAAIGSVRRQSLQDFELLVVDDGSTDDTVAVANRAIDGDARVRVLELPHGGVCVALNAGLQACSGEYVGWLDSDDALAPNALERTVAVLDAKPSLGMVYSQHLVMNDAGKVLGLGARTNVPYSATGLLTDFMTFQFRLLRRTLLSELGGVDESMRHAEDYDFCLRLSELAEIEHLAEPLYFYRVHDRALSHTHRSEQVLASQRTVERALARRGLARDLELRIDAGGRFRLVNRPRGAAPTHDEARERAGAGPSFRWRSAIEGVAWPAVSTGVTAQLMALQRQLDETQWWPAQRLRAEQLRQARLLLGHAAAQVPFYAERLRDAGLDPGRQLTEAAWARLPILTRREVQELGDALNAGETPAAHGNLTASSSGGSSGIPVRVQKTAVDNLFWSAVHVREELWHRENPRATLARIRRVPPNLDADQAAQVRSPQGLILPTWGPPLSLLWETGALAILDDRVAIEAQADFLRRHAPEYLFTFPSNLRLLLAHFRDSGQKLRSLRSVWTMSEVVDDSMRALCRELFGCRIVHNYTASEAGYLALQCPSHDHFHVQSEVVLLEVLDQQGKPCRPGEVGRVIVTPLHNFATPLLRYELGDEAEVGEACPCGRGLPVLRRIVGRSYDYLKLPSGGVRRVDTGFYQICKIPALREFQLVQRELDRIELLLVLSRPLAAAEQSQIEQILRAEFGGEFRIELSVRDAIARTEAGKVRTFVSEC